jgi:hypothetical protein
MSDIHTSTAESPRNPRPGLIQSPELTDAGKPTQRSIKDAGMGQEVVKTLVQANRNRHIVNSRILAKYNAERPYDAAKLEAEGLGWRQNFTTKPLPLMIEKVAPRFTEAVHGLKYLTNSKLSDKYQNSVEKTEKFREVTTRTIRSRKGWRTLVEDIAFDNALFGHSVVSVLDEFSWFPTHFKQDENFLSDGIKQTTSYAQVVALKETMLPHELFDKIKDAKAAEDAGWNVEECRTQINKASPDQIRDRLNVGGTLETWYQNAARELVIGASYMAGASVIVVYSLLAREVTGKVSHYRFAGLSLNEIFTREDRFDNMESCLSFFAFQKGNGTMHGSKGIGRDIYELAGMLDRTRNEIVDRSILSGKMVIQGDIKRIHTYKMSVIGSTIILPENWKITDQKMDGNIEPFLKLDAYFSMLVDQLIGSTSPPAQLIQGERKSPELINLFASREEEARDVRISRFLEQFTDMVSLMQKRIYDLETDEKDAKSAQQELLDFGLTREEINELANQVVVETVRDLTPQQRQLIVAVASEKKGNPLYNQRQLEVEDLTARIGSDFSKRVLLPQNDPTEQAEQQRLQMFENVMLMQGQPVPVSPRDNPEIHLSVVVPTAEQMAKHLMDGKVDTKVFEAVIAHITEHYNQALHQGIPKDKLKAVADLVKKAGPALAQLKTLDQQAMQLSAATQRHNAEGPQLTQ